MQIDGMAGAFLAAFALAVLVIACCVGAAVLGGGLQI